MDQPRPVFMPRGDIGMPHGLRPVQVSRPVQLSKPPPLIRINKDVPPPPKLTPCPPRPLVQFQRPTGSPNNLAGVVNIGHLTPKLDNSLGPKVFRSSTNELASNIRSFTPGSLQPKLLDPGLVTGQQTIRALNRSLPNSSLSMTSPPQLSPSLPSRDVESPIRPSMNTPSHVSNSVVKGIKNLTPIETGLPARPPNFRPVQVRTMSVHQPAAPKLPSPQIRRSSTDGPVTTTTTISPPKPTNTKTSPIASKNQDGAGEIDDEEDLPIGSIQKTKIAEKLPQSEEKQIKQPVAAAPVTSKDNEPTKPKPPLQSRFVRRADGKGFIRRDVIRARNLLNLHKKKKKPYRGVNYRFDGSSIKKRVSKKNANQISPTSSISSDSPLAPPAEPVSVLSYLGIQRKNSSEVQSAKSHEMNPKSQPKAKKSFRPTTNTEQLQSETRSESDVMPPGPQSLASNRKRSLENFDTNLTQPNKRAKETQEDLPIKSNPEDFICECSKADDLPNRGGNDDTDLCQAVESVGGSRVGCKNLAADSYLRRSGAKLESKQFCRVHVARLQAHNACAFCGEFCAHGAFFLCRPHGKSQPHLFHIACYNLDIDKRCPHCNSLEKPLQVQLKLSMAKMPMTLLNSYSKITFPYKVDNAKAKVKKQPCLTYTLPDGRVISSEGLPTGLGDDDLKKIIDALEDKNQLKHTTRNMLAPAKSGDNVRLIQLLSLGYSVVQKFAEIKGGTLLHVASSEGHVLTAHILLQVGAELDALDNEQCSSLMIACSIGKVEMVRYLLGAGADITLRRDNGMTCLHLAAQNGHLECVHAILSKSRVPKKFINMEDDGGWTPLVWACENKHEDVIRYLLENGSDPFITDADGNIALHWAAYSGSRVSCELLLNYGCDVNTTNTIGDTPLHIVLRQDHYDCAVLFLMRAAKIDCKNSKGLTPPECMPPNKHLKCKMVVQLTSTLNTLMKDAKKERIERIVSNDLTRGKEPISIQVVNDLDDEQEPRNYVYTVKNCQTTPIPIDRNISTLQHCKCTDNCSSENTCNCSDLSVKSWYDLEGRLKDGFDYREPPMIFECNDLCWCSVNICRNRVLQHGITVRLQVFRAFGMGWGVRPLSDIPKGTFVCEYVGEIISDSEAETREDSYLFDLDNKEGETFCIDANKFGNIARFINHSCSPNLVPVKVFAEHQDLRFPHIALFANRDIQKGEELGFDYGEKFWVIKHKQFTCHCGSEKCHYSKSRINGFLVEYYKRLGEPMPDELAKTIEDQPEQALTNGKASNSKGKHNQDREEASAKSASNSDADTSGNRSKKRQKESSS